MEKKREGKTKEKGLKLVHKIFLSNMLIAAVSMGLYGAYIYLNSIDSSKTQLFENARVNMQEVIGDMNAVTRRVEVQAGSMLLDDAFTSEMSGMKYRSPKEKYDAYLRLQKLCSAAEYVDDLYDISLVFSDKIEIFNNRERFFFDNLAIGERMKEDSRKWFQNHSELKGSLIYGVRTYSGMDGYTCLLFGIKDRIVREWEERLSFFGGETAFLFTGDEPPGMSGSEEGRIMERITALGATEGDFVISIRGMDYYVLYGKGEGPFFAVTAFPSRDIERRAAASVQKMMYILVPILFLIFVVSCLVSLHITRRLRSLSETMDTLYGGDLQDWGRRGKDEIDLLNDSFFGMQERINHAMEAVKEAEEKRVFAELNLLQAQINPHFLYNALDNINWLAVKMHVPQISYIVKNMSDYLRTGLNMGRQMSTLGNEIRHIKSYFNIQKFRFENRIHLHVDIPEGMMNLQMNALTLQPIVENAIIHGILVHEGRTGEIRVSAEEIDGVVMISVSDDGVGIPEEELWEINRKIKSLTTESNEESMHGFGLYNVNQRIQYTFGKEYGLDLISQPGEGTICIVSLPVSE